MNLDTIRKALDDIKYTLKLPLELRGKFETSTRSAICQIDTLLEALAALSTIDPDAETGFMIEKHNPMPMWWNGCLKREGNGSWSTDPNDGIRFSRKVDAELCAIAQGFSLSKVLITEHRWS